MRALAATLAFLTILPLPATAQSSALAWPAVTQQSRPWTRWWWLGSAVDSANLTAGLEELAAAGFGGVEVTAIYGVRGYESAFVPYLSERWVKLLAHSAAEARRLGMGIDMPPGSGWRSGGPFVPASDANASLQVTVDTVRPGERWARDLSGRRVDAVMAFSSGGGVVEVARGQPPAAVEWTAPAGGGSWTVYAAGTRLSGDNVKRPAPGGEGYAIDVFSRAATRNFLTAYGERLRGLPHGAMRSWFHDSFEYTGNASPELFEFFRARRGYDLARYLPALLGRGGGGGGGFSADTVARVKSDYRQTLDEMLLEHFVRPLGEWSRARGSLSRNQAHGSPGNLLDLYAASDIPETEIFGPLDGPDSDPLINKFASSAAHVAGKPLASAEAFTWLGEHFQATLDEVKQAADELFLSGINHLIYHGTAYSPRQAPWPGWQFYASAEFNPRNAFWRDLPALNQYVARVQSVLQTTRPDNDVLLYWPVWDSWHDTAGMRMDFRVHAPRWLHEKPVGKVAAALWNGGYGFDYVSDRLLAEHVTAGAGGRLRGAGGGEYRAIVVPRADHMPDETLGTLLAYARQGATVIFLERLPADVPGLARHVERRRRLEEVVGRVSLGGPDPAGVRRAAFGRGRVLVGDDLTALLAAAGVRREAMADLPGVRVIRRRRDDGWDYFVSSAGPAAVASWVPLAVPAAAVAIMDPASGRGGLAAIQRRSGGPVRVQLHLEAGGSLVLRTFDRAVRAAPWDYQTPLSRPEPVRTDGWQVEFVEGGPVLPAGFRGDAPVAWTGRGDADADRFAGTARYTARFDDPGTARSYLLDLGRVAESARVRLNGKELGTLFARPFRVETGPLRPTGNVLEVEVTNLSANRVRDLDRRGVQWRIFMDINYVNIDYRPFDASGWPVRTSGLVGPVTLQPLAASR